MDFLHELASEYGYKAIWCDISVIDEIDAEYQKNKNDYSDALKSYTGLEKSITKAKALDSMKSICILCYPYFEQKRAVLNYEDKRLELIIPAGYAIGRDNAEIPRQRLCNALSERGIKYQEVRPALKNMLSRVGLSEYGRNNIAYVEGFGSMHSIIAYACDYEPQEKATLREPSRMSRCDNCDLCIKACKSGAISKESKMIDFQKCITYYNEQTLEWPEWIKPHMQRHLVGCNSCQLCCPANKGLSVLSETVEFTMEETLAMKKGTDREGEVWQSIMDKLYDIGIKGYLDAICNNVKMLS